MENSIRVQQNISCECRELGTPWGRLMYCLGKTWLMKYDFEFVWWCHWRSSTCTILCRQPRQANSNRSTFRATKNKRSSVTSPRRARFTRSYFRLPPLLHWNPPFVTYMIGGAKPPHCWFMSSTGS